MHPWDCLTTDYGLSPAAASSTSKHTVPVIDIDVVERNVARWQDRCNRRARQPPASRRTSCQASRTINLPWARKHLRSKLGEAEVMADVSITDTAHLQCRWRIKLSRLTGLMKRTAFRMADNSYMLDGLSGAATQAGGRCACWWSATPARAQWRRSPRRRCLGAYRRRYARALEAS